MTTYFVYKLSEGPDAPPFYIGCSKNLEKRLSYHFSEPSSSARSTLRSLRSSGSQYGIYPIKRFKDKKRANSFELGLIKSTPNILNKTGLILPLAKERLSKRDLPKDAPKNEMISLRLDTELLARLMRLVRKSGDTKTALIERGVTIVLKQEGEK